MSNEVNVALVKGRHQINWQEAAVSEAVWDSVPTERMLDMEWLESRALGWFNKLGKHQSHIRLFITGLTQCTVAFLKSYAVVYMHRPNPPTLSLMFWDRDSETYVESRWDE